MSGIRECPSVTVHQEREVACGTDVDDASPFRNDRDFQPDRGAGRSSLPREDKPLTLKER